MYCSGKRLRKKSSYIRSVKHESIGYRYTLLRFKACKFYCHDCQRYFNQQFSGIGKHNVKQENEKRWVVVDMVAEEKDAEATKRRLQGIIKFELCYFHILRLNHHLIDFMSAIDNNEKYTQEILLEILKDILDLIQKTENIVCLCNPMNLILYKFFQNWLKLISKNKHHLSLLECSDLQKIKKKIAVSIDYLRHMQS